MALNMIALVLVAGLTFVHSIFGFYSGLINVFCTIVAGVVALGFAEALTGWAASAMGLHTAYIGACALIVLFALTLTILRLAADNLIRGNVHVPQWLDWGGAGVCGFVIAQICTGILVLGVMKLPLTGRVLGFERYERVDELQNPEHSERPLFERKSIWTRSDDFTVGLVNLVSSGSLKGGTEFREVYPNYVDAVYFSGNTIQPESTPAPLRDEGGDGFKGVNVLKWWTTNDPIDVRYRRDKPTEKDKTPNFKPISGFRPASGLTFLGMRLQLRKAAADRDRKSARHLFRPTMVRLVGKIGERPVQYTPLVISGAEEKSTIPRLVDYDNNFSITESDPELDVFFEVDPEFKPSFVEYRRYARASMSGKQEEGAPQTALAPGAGSAQADAAAAGGRTVGRVFSSSFGGSGLPFECNATNLRRTGVTMEGNELKSGYLFSSVDRLEAKGSDAKAESFYAPDGWRLVQLRYQPKEARTLPGQVLRYVGNALNQYTAEDDEARPYPLAGYYAVATRGNSRYIELIYTGDPTGVGTDLDVRFNGMLTFRELTNEEVNADDTQMGLLFLVKPAAVVIRLRNQNGDAVEGFRVVAPK